MARQRVWNCRYCVTWRVMSLSLPHLFVSSRLDRRRRMNASSPEQGSTTFWLALAVVNAAHQVLVAGAPVVVVTHESEAAPLTQLVVSATPAAAEATAGTAVAAIAAAGTMVAVTVVMTVAIVTGMTVDVATIVTVETTGGGAMNGVSPSALAGKVEGQHTNTWH